MYNEYKKKNQGGKNEQSGGEIYSSFSCISPCLLSLAMNWLKLVFLWGDHSSSVSPLSSSSARQGLLQALGLAPQSKAEASWHDGVWFIDCSMMENILIHQKVVNVKPCYAHPFPFLWPFPSFSLIFSCFLSQNRELAGLRRVTPSTASPVFFNWRKQSQRERGAGVSLIWCPSSEMPQPSKRVCQSLC